jgi:acyl-[acyl-carrier-protein]-phospholipid O-acyltransferase/long-chain-fatty-acid--[acyl-carrier-protein] ligase
MLTRERISKGNGWMGLITVVASALGFVAGNYLFAALDYDLSGSEPISKLLPAVAALLGTAIAGCLTSLLIVHLKPADAARPVPPNPITETARSLRLLFSNVGLLRTALGIAFFWFLASMAQMTIDVLGINELALEQQNIGILLGILVLGVGIGSILAGLWSGQKVELGIVPLGAAGMAVSALLLYLAGNSVDHNVVETEQQAYTWVCLWLFTLGISAGLFNIPLESFLQQRSDVKTRGTILAASNFLSFSLMLSASGRFLLLNSVLGMSASQIFLVSSVATVPVVIYAFAVLPQATIRFVVWFSSKTIYRVRINHLDNLPESGGALLVCNHVSWLDGVFLLMTSSRPIRMIAYADYVSTGPAGWLCRTFGVIPIRSEDGPKALIRSLQTARNAIMNGELVCIFAEGGITRTGQLQPFQRGMMRIVRGTNAPVIPVYLDELWGSIFSFRGGRFFWKRPRRWPYPVTISFGKPLADADNANQVRQAVQHLGVESVEMRKSRELIPARTFVRKCRSRLFQPKVADSGGKLMTGGKLLAGTVMFKRLLERQVLAADEKHVGLLVPPSVGGAIANTAVSLSGRVAVNLNYTLSSADMNYCIRESGIRTVITSRRFLEKRPFDLEGVELVYLEDLAQQLTLSDKIAGVIQSYVLPAAVTERLHGLTKIDPEEVMTIIFTSGSTGEPKGVMLTHNNIASNAQGVDQSFNINPNDAFLGVLPFFHSFGYTVTLWVVLTLDVKGVYHFNPLDAREVGKLCQQHGVTILISTPTFLRSYLKRCTPEQFQSVDLVILGAEKMPLELANACQEKFGIQPTEGYGTTELSPVAAANIPDHRSGSTTQSATKFGTVGRPFPGVTAKVIDADSGEDVGANHDGLLLIKGSNVMKGYLNQPEKTAEVLKDGWYNTGDVAKIDDDGFIEITGRQSRFSKIGGEMVPHIKVEELLNQIVEDTAPDNDAAEGVPDVNLAVTSMPDEKKGERLIVVHKHLKMPVSEILKELADTGIPNLWIPANDSFVEVEQVPVLGTGKLDLRGLKELAAEKFQPAASEKN